MVQDKETRQQRRLAAHQKRLKDLRAETETKAGGKGGDGKETPSAADGPLPSPHGPAAEAAENGDDGGHGGAEPSSAPTSTS